MDPAKKWSIGGSNPWPSDCEPDALPAELMPRDKFPLIENQCPMEGDFLFDFNFTTGKATSATTNIIKIRRLRTDGHN